MIGFMPEIYPNELVYSWLARYHVRSGNGEKNATFLSLFDSNRQKRVSIQFINLYGEQFSDFLSKFYSIDELLYNHTMFGVYSKFYDNDFKKYAKKLIIKQRNSGRIMATKSPNYYFKYCPLCAKEDREKYGETYWHVEWAISEIDICTIHCCKMVSTNIKIYGDGKPNDTFCMADLEIPFEEEPDFNISRSRCDFFQYVIDVISQKEIQCECPLEDYLNAKLLDTKYRAFGKGSRKVTRLYDDLKDFCIKKDIPEIDRRVIRDFLFNKNPYYLNVCIIAYFLNLDSYEFVNRPAEYLKENINIRDIEKIRMIANDNNLIYCLKDSEMGGILKIAENNYDNKEVYDLVVKIFIKKISILHSLKPDMEIALATIRKLYSISKYDYDKFPEIEAYLNEIN